MNSKISLSIILLLLLSSFSLVFAQKNVTKANDSNTPLHLITPDYPVPYGIVKTEEITSVLNRIHGYLNEVTPTNFINSKTGEILTDLAKIDENTALQKGDFRIVSYEWGVTYSAMLLASQATGDIRFKDYVEKRLKFIAESVPYFQKTSEQNADWGTKDLCVGW